MAAPLTGSTRRARFFLGLTARVAILTLVFQLLAFDHWHGHPSEMVGVEGSSKHVSHCHGGDSCASQNAIVDTLDNVSLTPLPPSSLRVSLPDPAAEWHDAFVATLDQPPRSNLPT